MNKPFLENCRPSRLKQQSRYLLSYAGGDDAQQGETGIIEKAFEIIGAKNRWCVEFGAWDGRLYSNTHVFITGGEWNGVLIEGEKDRFCDLQETYRGNDRAQLFNLFIGFDPERDTIEHVLAQTDAPHDLDFMVIDIDGNDFHVWQSMIRYQPRLMIVEFNPTVPNDIAYVQERHFDVMRGCSLRALIELGRSRGYELICATAFNAFFVVANEYEKFGIEDNSIDAMYQPFFDGRVFQAYDQTVHISGVKPFPWSLSGVQEDWAKVIPERLYVYG